MSRTRKPSIDAIVTFNLDGKVITAAVKRTRFIGGALVYIWNVVGGGTVETVGLPKGLKVVADA